jgi:hypothetical protein
MAGWPVPVFGAYVRCPYQPAKFSITLKIGSRDGDVREGARQEGLALLGRRTYSLVVPDNSFFLRFDVVLVVHYPVDYQPHCFSV